MRRDYYTDFMDVPKWEKESCQKCKFLISIQCPEIGQTINPMQHRYDIYSCGDEILLVYGTEDNEYICTTPETIMRAETTTYRDIKEIIEHFFRARYELKNLWSIESGKNKN